MSQDTERLSDEQINKLRADIVAMPYLSWAPSLKPHQAEALLVEVQASRKLVADLRALTWGDGCDDETVIRMIDEAGL